MQPLLQICWKLGPALATGNACVIKPSEVTPLSTIYLVRHILLDASVGLPAQAVQLLTAAGSGIGRSLTESGAVDLVSFTGGLATGRQILAACAAGVKRCCVELGGKNPHIVFADVDDVDRAAETVVTAAFLHAGQVCSAGTRVIVEESIADDLVQRVVQRAQRIVLGSGLDARSESGPLVSAQQLRKMHDYVALGLREGAVLRCGGGPPDAAAHPELARGFFFAPTVLDQCHGSMAIVQHETFGPILTVERFAAGDEARAVALANDTPYGLAGGVQTGSAARGQRVAARLRHGTVWINTYGSYSARAEWGGYGMSGNGRELGRKGLDEYVETKHTWTETSPQPMGWFKAQGALHSHGPHPQSEQKSKL